MQPFLEGQGLVVDSRRHIRAHYSARCQQSAAGNLRNVSSRIAVAVGEDATYHAEESVAPTCTTTTANRTGLRRIGWVDVSHTNSIRFGLIRDELLELSPCPAVEPGSHFFACSNPRTKIAQILHCNSAAIVLQSLAYDASAYLVIDMAHMARLPTGDSLQASLCRLRAVALKSLTECQETIAQIFEFSTSIERVIGSGSDILAKIDSEDPSRETGSDIGQGEGDVQGPPTAASNQFGFTNRTARQIFALKLAKPERNMLAPNHCKEGNRLADDTESARVEMHRSVRAKHDCIPRAALGTVGFKAMRHRSDRITGHLGPQCRKAFADGIVGQVVQAYPISRRVRGSDQGDGVARGSIDGLQVPQRTTLATIYGQVQRNCPLHRQNLSPYSATSVALSKKERRFCLGFRAETPAPDTE